MRKLILSLTLLALAGAAYADVVVPAGKAAVVEAVVGKAAYVRAKASKPLTVGLALEFGDRIETGENGRVFLRLADQAVSRIAANTEMTLDAPGKRQGTYLTLVKGWARFLVGQRKEGSAFDVNIANAVAAVKGTDWEGGSEDGKGQVRVYQSEHHPALDFNDPKSGQGVGLDAGQGAEFDGGAFTKFDKLEKMLRRDEQQRYQGLPDTAPAAEAAAPDEGDRNKALTEIEQLLQESVAGVLDDAMRDISLDQHMERDERANDLAASRYAIDQNGYEVQISHYVQRPLDDTVVLTTVNTRTQGPDTGATTAVEATQWNQALPEDWMSVAKTALNDPSNIDPVTGWASYFRVNQTFLASNPLGDGIFVNTNLDEPFYLGAAGPGNLLYQTWTQSVALKMGAYPSGGGGGGGGTVAAASANAPAGYMPFTSYIVSDNNLQLDAASGHYYDSYASNVANLFNSGDLYITTLDGVYNLNPQVSASGTQYIYTDNQATSDRIVFDLGLYDATGIRQADPSAGAYPSPADFKGADPSLNVAVSIRWQDYYGYDLFLQPINLMFMPQYFDTMLMLQFPETTVSLP